MQLVERPLSFSAPPPPKASVPKVLRRRLGRFGPPFAFFVVILAIWELISASLSGSRKFLLPPPQSVVMHGLLAHDAYSQILPSFLRTAVLAFGGLTIAMFAGMLVAAIMYRFAWLERAAFPYLVALQAVPVLAVAPLIAVILGYSYIAKGLVVVLIAFFPIPANFLLGLRSVDSGLEDLFRLQRSSWWTRFWRLAFPNALPQLFTSFRIAAGLAVIGAIVGEEFFQAGVPGLGMRLLQYLDQVEYNRLYGALILSSLLGIAFYSVFTWVSHRVLRSWHESVQPGR
ncbi:MAG: ABC transporter permease [Ferrimicrobium sp.]